MQLTGLAALIVAATFVVAWPAVDGDWQWDDDISVTANPVVQGPYSLGNIWIAPTGPDYFPLTTTGFWLEWHCFGRVVRGYHVVNIVLHALSSLLLWALVATMGLPGGWVAGLLFAVHPLCVESVAWISELKNTLAQPLFLAAAIHAVRADSRDARSVTLDDVAALAWFLLAMFAKTSVVMFPVVMLLHAWWRRGALRPRDLVRAAPFFLVSLLLGLVTLHFQHTKAIGDEAIPVGGPASRLALSGMSALFSIGKVLLPVGLVPIYPRWEVDPPRPWQFLPWAAIVAVVVLAWRQRQSWGRHLLFALGFFLLMILPVLGFVTIAYMRITWAADHFVYLPMISIIVLVAAAAAGWYGRLPADSRPPAAAVGMALVAALGVTARTYAAAWVNEKSLWTHTLASNPDAWQAHNRIGSVIMREGDVQTALEHFEAASRLRPDLGETHNNRAQALLVQGRIAEAIEAAEAAAAASPQMAIVRFNLANTYAAAGRPADAEAVLLAMLTEHPEDVTVRTRRADMLALLSRIDEAAAQYRMVIERAPRNAAAWNNRGVCLWQLGRVPEAITCFNRALELAPGFADAAKNLEQIRKAVPQPGAPGRLP